MRRVIIAILLLLLCISFASADVFTPPADSVAGFKINVPVGSSPLLEVRFFSYLSTEHKKITRSLSDQASGKVTDLSPEDDGTVPKLAFRVKTRRYYNVNIRLNFSPMINDDSEADIRYKYGFYDVVIYGPIYWDTGYMDDYVGNVYDTLSVDSKSGASVEITAPSNLNELDTWLYPLAVDFSDYIDGYNGDYTATIMLEVLSQ